MVLISFLFLGCTGQQAEPKNKELVLPAITSNATGKQHTGKIVWHDLLTDNISSSKTFYAGLFGWSFEKDGPYTLIINKGKRIGGMMHISHKDKSQTEAVWLASLSVPDVDKALSYVKSKKGRVLKGPLDMKKRGRGALISDPYGAHIVLLQAKNGDPVDAEARIGDWLWNELWTSTEKSSYNFYRKLAAYDSLKVSDDYRILKSKGKWRAGIRTLENKDAKSRWVPVVRVADIADIIKKVTKLGGKVLVDPDDTLMDGNVAVIADPNGALFIVQRWEEET